MTEHDFYQPDFSKLIDPATGTGLLPAVILNDIDRKVLMVGFMNQEAFLKTVTSGLVTFWSRTRRTIWTKGETSGNFLQVRSWRLDCDSDTLLIAALATGPTCHLPDRWSCFD